MNNSAELIALQTQIRVLKHSLNQAQETIATMTGRLPEGVRHAICDTIIRHMRERGVEKAEQYELIINTTLLGLNEVAKNTSDAETRPRVLDMIRALNITIHGESPKG